MHYVPSAVFIIFPKGTQQMAKVEQGAGSRQLTACSRQLLRSKDTGNRLADSQPGSSQKQQLSN